MKIVADLRGGLIFLLRRGTDIASGRTEECCLGSLSIQDADELARQLVTVREQAIAARKMTIAADVENARARLTAMEKQVHEIKERIAAMEREINA